MVEVARALQLLAENKIVHSDLKTENILIRLKYAEQTEENMAAEKDVSLIEDVKLIDYGSSFTFSNLKQFSMATPEYMAPEILNYILFEN
jgi:dual specificity tyrosine-phosphorylation-regulated kinase 2/3/4